MIKRRKNIKESKVAAEYSARWEEALEAALDQLNSEHYGEMNGSDQMYFTLTDRYGSEIGYEGFAAFDRIEGDSLIMHVVYPEQVSVLDFPNSFLENTQEPDIDVESIKSEAEKEQALDEMDEYINSLKDDLRSLKDWKNSDGNYEINVAMSEKGRVEELEIELPDDEWIDFDEFDSEESAILNTMKEAIISELDSYIESVSREADDVISDASIEISDLIDEISEKLSDAEDKRREIEDMEFDNEEFESVRRRRNLRRVIESRRARAKKESLRDLFWIEKSSDTYSSEEYVDSIETGISMAKSFVTRKYSNRSSPVYVVKVFSGSRFSPKLHFVATNAKKGNIEIDEPIDFFAGTTDRKFSESLRRRITRK